MIYIKVSENFKIENENVADGCISSMGFRKTTNGDFVITENTYQHFIDLFKNETIEFIENPKFENATSQFM